MKAVRVNQPGGPEVMVVEDIPIPKIAEGQALVKVEAAGVNPVDTYIRSGAYFPIVQAYTPGMDAAGTVEAVGSGVSKVKVGDKVYTAGSITGTYAEYVLCQEKQVYPLPEGLSFEEGAAINVPYATAFTAMHLVAQIKPGESMLVHGASGGVGIAAVQLGLAFGASVAGTASTTGGRDLVQSFGPVKVFDHNQDGYMDRIKDACGGGVDVILEMLANVNLNNDLQILSRYGRVVVIGSRGNIEITPRFTMQRNASIRGMTLMNNTDEETALVHAGLAAGFRNETLKPIVREKIPLAEAPRSHQLVMQSGAYGKIVLIPD